MKKGIVHVPQSVKDRVNAKIDQCRRKAKEVFGKEFPVRVTYDLRGTCGGKAGYGFIRLNSVLLMENGENFINQTVPHEFAHCVQFVMYPYDRPHGNGWKRIMRLFGCEPRRCHSYDTTNAQVRKGVRHEYHCKCDTFQLTTNRHNKIQRGVKMWCKNCQHLLALPGQESRHRFDTKEVSVQRIVNPQNVITVPKVVETTEDTGPVYRAVFNPITCTLENVPV